MLRNENTKVLLEEREDGYLICLEDKDCMRKNVWVLPLLVASHWSLIIVLFSTRTIFLIDSLFVEKKIPKEAIQRICCFVDFVFNKNCPNIDWSTWSLCVPHNILQQNDNYSCGIHMLTYIYAICHKKNIQFDNDEINSIRRWIFDEILLQHDPDLKPNYKFPEIILFLPSQEVDITSFNFLNELPLLDGEKCVPSSYFSKFLNIK